jgi:hypothetical protein
MASYDITINERMSLGKNLIAYLQSIPQVVTFKRSHKKKDKKSWLYYELEGAFADVRLMMDGKKREKTIEELIDELPDYTD